MASEEANQNMTFTDETVENERKEQMEAEEGESSTSAANVITDTVRSKALDNDVDQTEAQSTTILLPSPQELLEGCGAISTPQVSQQSVGSAARFFRSAAPVQQEEAFGAVNIEQDMMNLLPPNQPDDASSQIMFEPPAALETMVCEENAFNISHQPNNTYENSHWPLNSYQFPMSNLPPDFVPLAPMPNIPLSDPQAPIGCGNSQYSHSFLQTTPSPLSTPFGTQGIQFQGLLNQGPSSGFFSSGGGNLSMQFQQTRMNMQDMTSSSNLHLSSNWISQGTNFSNISTNPNSRRNAVYDPAYESMGLPVDPHLRMFLARRDAAADNLNSRSLT